MSNTKDNFAVSIVKYACPICGKIDDSADAIIMNSKLTKAAAQEVKSLHKQVVGFSDKPCKECQSYIDKGAFFIIGIDSDKTEDMKNPYRSGHLVGIKKDSEFFKHLPDEYKKKDAIYMDWREMQKFGMIN